MKKNFICLILFSIVLIIGCFLGCYLYLNRIPSAKEVFSKSQDYVVELKATADDDLVTYGSAVIIDTQGTLISNAHMVTYKKGGKTYEFKSFGIRFSFEKDFRPVTLIKYESDEDISVLRLESIDDLKIRAPKLKANKKLHSGDTIYAVGNGLNHGVGITMGVISLPLVNIEYNANIRSVIQGDIIINDGNSGGALLDENGGLIGITTFRLNDDNGNPIYGIAYAIPLSRVLEFLG